VAAISSPDHAKIVEKTILNLVAKISINVDNKVVTPDGMLKVLRVPILVLWSDFIDTGEFNEAMRDFKALADSTREVYIGLKQVFSNVFGPNAFSKLRELFSFFCLESTLQKIFNEHDGNTFEARQRVCNYLRKLWDTKLTKQDRNLVMQEKFKNQDSFPEMW